MLSSCLDDHEFRTLEQLCIRLRLARAKSFHRHRLDQSLYHASRIGQRVDDPGQRSSIEPHATDVTPLLLDELDLFVTNVEPIAGQTLGLDGGMMGRKQESRT